MATAAMVKWDKNGNPVVSKGSSGGSGGNKPKRYRLDFGRVVKDNAGYVATAAVGGALAVGVGTGLVSMIPPLRRWAAVPGWQRTAVVGGVSLVAAGIGLAVYSKVTTPKKALDAAPWVLGGTAVLVVAPMLATEVVNRIDSFMRGMLNTPATTTPTGQGPLPRMRARAALTPQQVLVAQARQQQRARVPVGATLDASLEW